MAYGQRYSRWLFRMRRKISCNLLILFSLICCKNVWLGGAVCIAVAMTICFQLPLNLCRFVKLFTPRSKKWGVHFILNCFAKMQRNQATKMFCLDEKFFEILFLRAQNNKNVNDNTWHMLPITWLCNQWSIVLNDDHLEEILGGSNSLTLVAMAIFRERYFVAFWRNNDW